MNRDIRSGALLALVLLTALPSGAAEQARSATARTAAQAGTTVLKDIQRTVMGDIVRVVIELEAEVSYHTDRVENPARVLFDLESTRVGSALSEGTLTYPTDVVRHIRIGRHPNRVVRVVLDLEGVTKYSVFTLYSPYRIVVDCERGPALPPVPSERIAEEKVRPPIPDPAEAPGQVKSDAQAKSEARPKSEASPKVEAPPKPEATPPPRSETLKPEAQPRAATPPARPVVSRPLPTGRLALTPRVVAPPAWSVPPATPVVSTETRAAAVPAEPTLPLKVTRQYRLTRYPTWQPVVLAPPQAARAEMPAAASPAPPAVAPAVMERTSATPDKAPLDKPAIASEPLTAPSSGFSMARQLGLGAARIVIDPGHGGHDPGAEGTNVFEAHVVLDIALRLEKLLTAAGIEVVLTRRTDEYIPLEERTAIANRAHGDLFLSIHANASRNRAARGIESYVLNFASTPDAEAVAARENASTGLTMSSLTEIVKAIALNNKLDESRNFAGIIQREMVSHLRGANRDLKNLGVKQAPFVVLIGASMPSVLAEISFITHVQEGRLLKTGAYRQKIAEALFDAVRGYQKSLKGSAVLTRQ